MGIHVDVVNIDWVAVVQHPATSACIVDGRLHVDADDPDRWRAIVIGAAADAHPEKEAERFRALLHKRMNGSRVFATEPHDEQDCPYKAHPVRYIQSIDVDDATRAQPA